MLSRAYAHDFATKNHAIQAFKVATDTTTGATALLLPARTLHNPIRCVCNLSSVVLTFTPQGIFTPMADQEMAKGIGPVNHLIIVRAWYGGPDDRIGGRVHHGSSLEHGWLWQTGDRKGKDVTAILLSNVRNGELNFNSETHAWLQRPLRLRPSSAVL